MKFVKKSIKIILIIIAVILLFIVGLLIFYFLSKSNNTKKEDEKLTYQIKYLDSRLTECINMLEKDTINKTELENKLEEIYEYWNNMILDLSLNRSVSKEEINIAGQNINKVLIAINDMKEVNIKQSLIELYGSLVRIYEQSKYNEEFKSVLVIKYNLLNSKLMVEKKEWINAGNFVNNANEIITQIFNSEDETYNINLAYISIKELESIMSLQNYNLFLIKYEIAMENLNKI